MNLLYPQQHVLERKHFWSQFVNGKWEIENMLCQQQEQTTSAVNAVNRRSIIFLDVGANVGWFSLLAAAHGGAQEVYTIYNIQ